MQALDVISVNVWSILISLCNLGLIFWLVKKFLFKPVKAVLAKRQAEIDAHYQAAEDAQKNAESSREQYELKLAGAQAEADSMIQSATATANRRSDRIVSDARDKADSIIRQAQNEAELEKKKAQETIRQEIADVSAALTEKLLGREMNQDDHRGMIDSFLNEMGEQQ